ncbi:L,D-transpeptidase family protein [Streptomyces krungchingensis]
MRRGSARHAIASTAACGLLLTIATACGDTTAGRSPGGAPGTNGPASASPRSAKPDRVPGIGDRMWRQVPADTRQVVAVYGDDRDSPDGVVALYEKKGETWKQTGSWPAHNGKLGWTTDHQMDDERSPVGVFTLTDAGGVLADPGSRLKYRQDDHAFASTIYWDEAHEHDFDYVIAIDYNRIKGTPPYDWSRPLGVEKGGGIWLHLDHGDGTSGCVTVPESGMRSLLRTLDPARHPVVVMGDKERLKR